MRHLHDHGSDVPLQQSPLADRHATAGAKTAAFAGWEMPISYAGTVAEHTAVREDVGVFDVSHLGTVWVSGRDALATVDRAFTNDPRRLDDGQSQYSLCATEDGGVLDDLIVYRISDQRFMVVPNAANTPAVVQRLRDVAGQATIVDDESVQWAILAVQGPRALDLIGEAMEVDAHALAFGEHVVAPVHNTTARVCRTGYTGEQGVEVVVPVMASAEVWDAIVEAGAEPCGLAARDTLRLEMGYPLHGNDLGPDINPYEARSGWAVKLDGREFVGREALAAIREAGPARRLWGRHGDGRRPPRAGMDVAVDGVVVGTVTSGSFSPTLEVGIGLALLDAAVEAGGTATVDVRGTDVPFAVVRPPLVDRDPH